MHALFLHRLEQQGQVHGHAGNGGGRLGDEPLHHADKGLAVDPPHRFGKGRGRPVEILLGLTDGAVIVDGPGNLTAEVGIVGGDAAFGKNARFEQRVDP